MDSLSQFNFLFFSNNHKTRQKQNDTKKSKKEKEFILRSHHELFETLKIQ